MGAAIALVFLCFLVILIILIILIILFILFLNVFFHIFFCGGYRCLLASIIHVETHRAKRAVRTHTGPRRHRGLTIAGRPIFWRTDRGAIGFIADIGPISGRYRPI